MKNTYQVKITGTGAITIPRKLREKYSVEDSTVLALTDLGNGIIILRPQRLEVDEIADDLSKQWQASGVSLEIMLDTLRDVRTEFDAK